MVTGGGVARGYLRPGFARSPPLLLIALILITGISVFNYWNLSAQYSDVVKEITELQEHIRVITSKHEAAEKHVEGLRGRLRDTEDQMGKLKLIVGEKNVKLNEAERLINLKTNQITKLESQLKAAEDAAKQRDAEQSKRIDEQHDLERLRLENSIVKEKNTVLVKTLADLRVKMSTVMEPAARFKVPNIVQVDHSKTENQADANIQSNAKEINETEDIVVGEGEAVTERVGEEESRVAAEEMQEETAAATETNSSDQVVVVSDPNAESNVNPPGETDLTVTQVKPNKNPLVDKLKSQILPRDPAAAAVTRGLTSTTPTPLHEHLGDKETHH